MKASIKDYLLRNNVQISSLIQDDSKGCTFFTLIVKKGNDSLTDRILSKVSNLNTKSYEANKFHITVK
jgi:hypothetical protein